jgi:hypothetical protein
MPLTGSETILKGLIIAEMTSLIGDPAAIPNLEAMADALSKAIVTWITTAGKGAAVTPAPAIGVTGPLAPSGTTSVTIPVVTSDLI